AADDARLVRLPQRRGERGELLRLLAAVAGDRAGERIEQEVLAMIASALRNILVLQRCRETGQRLGDVYGHASLLASPRRALSRGALHESTASCDADRRMVIGVRARCQLVPRTPALATMAALFRPNVAAIPVVNPVGVGTTS